MNNFEMYLNDWKRIWNTFHKMMNLFKSKFKKNIGGITPTIFYKEVNLSCFKIQKEQMYVFPTIHMKEKTFWIIFK